MSIDEDAAPWQNVAVEPPGEGELATCQIDGPPLLVCRVEGVLYALEDACPHARAALSKGALRGTELECPFHGGKLDVRDGTPVAPPIRRPARCFPVRTREGTLEVATPTAR